MFTCVALSCIFFTAIQISSMTVDFKLNNSKAFDVIKLKKEADCVNDLGKLIVDMIQNSRHVTGSGVEVCWHLLQFL